VTIGHNALCTEARWGEEIPTFLKNGIKYFSLRGLDTRISVESAHEIRFVARIFSWRNGGQNLAVSAHAATDSLTELHLLKQILG
jgi:hypothetical protein